MTTTYCYDHADRLTSTTAPGVTALAYDTHGNTSTFGGETHVYDIVDRHVETRSATTPTALLVVGSPGSLTDRDTWLETRLEAAGHTVTVADDNGLTAGAATGKSIVVIADSVVPATLGSVLNTVAVPVVVSDSGVMATMGLTGTTSGTHYGTTTGQTQVAVTAAGATHPLGAGLNAGSNTTSTASITHGWATPAGTLGRTHRASRRWLTSWWTNPLPETPPLHGTHTRTSTPREDDPATTTNLQRPTKPSCRCQHPAESVPEAPLEVHFDAPRIRRHSGISRSPRGPGPASWRPSAPARSVGSVRRSPRPSVPRSWSIPSRELKHPTRCGHHACHGPGPVPTKN